MKVSFSDFWNDFSQDNNFLIHLLRMSNENVTLVEHSEADILIFSCFGDEHRKYNHCKKVFFTGENKRPDFNECDFSISFDFNDYDKRNIRIPLWYFYIDWFNVKTYGNPNYLIPINYLYGDNEFKKEQKDKFCCTVFSRLETTRNMITNKISEYKSVDGFGKAHSRRIPEGERVKLELISGYKFNICFENSVYPGYFTKKLLHAKIAGCIPIYYSDQNFNLDFDDNCCINYINYDNPSDLLEDIKRIDNDDNLYHRINNTPLFKNTIDLDNIVKDINNIIK